MLLLTLLTRSVGRYRSWAKAPNASDWKPKPFRRSGLRGVIDGFRWSILGGESKLYWQGFSLSSGLVFLMLITGIAYFRKMERTFADVT